MSWNSANIAVSNLQHPELCLKPVYLQMDNIAQSGGPKLSQLHASSGRITLLGLPVRNPEKAENVCLRGNTAALFMLLQPAGWPLWAQAPVIGWPVLRNSHCASSILAHKPAVHRGQRVISARSSLNCSSRMLVGQPGRGRCWQEQLAVHQTHAAVQSCPKPL